jgi:hypothetical protein
MIARKSEVSFPSLTSVLAVSVVLCGTGAQDSQHGVLCAPWNGIAHASDDQKEFVALEAGPEAWVRFVFHLYPDIKEEQSICEIQDG